MTRAARERRRDETEPDVSAELSASIDINAPAEQVFSVIADLKAMGKRSPQCKLMKVFGPVQEGTRSININRKGLLVWPTTAKVVRFEPGKALAFRINENRTVWTYELAESGGVTTVTETRRAPDGTSKVSSFLVDKFMGGTDDFDREMVEGMNQTLREIKAEVERG